MKVKVLLSAAAGLLLMASCQDGGNGSSSMPSNATQGDSLLYYLGQTMGAQYSAMAANDTTLATDAAKKAYLAGIKAGLNIPKQDDEAYNRGVAMGMQMAASFLEFNKEFNLTLDPKVFLSSVTATVLSDSMPDQREAQTKVSELFENIQKAKAEKDKAAAMETLNQAIAGKDLTKFADDLYGKITVKTDSAAIKDGDLVNINITVKNLAGEPVNFRFPPKGRVGAPNFPVVANDALLKMKSGETGEFTTTAVSLMGPRAHQMGVEPTEVLTFTLSASIQPESNNDKPTPNPAPEAARQVAPKAKK